MANIGEKLSTMRANSPKRKLCPYEDWVCKHLLKILEETMSSRNKKIISPKLLLSFMRKKKSIRDLKAKQLKTASLLENFFQNNKALRKYKKHIVQSGDFLASLERVFNSHPDKDYIMSHAVRYEKKFQQDEERSYKEYLEVLEWARSNERMSLKSGVVIATYVRLRGVLKHTRLGSFVTFLVLEELAKTVQLLEKIRRFNHEKNVVE